MVVGSGVLTEGMSMTREKMTGEIAQVRIPSELNASFDRFFSVLKRGILDQAVRRASLRAGADEVCVLQEEDLVAVAQAVLKDAASELDDAFSPSELHHVRRAS